MGRQEEIFVTGEGDNWFDRNQFNMEIHGSTDPLFDLLIDEGIYPTQVLEIGCSNGWRLNKIEEAIHTTCHGVDPSKQALANGRARFPNLDLQHGSATGLSMGTGSIDLLIYGFCLYVCDREDLFEIATQGDRILCDGGFLAIHDFDPDFPHSVPNHHVNGLFTYKMDYAKLWLANPSYSLRRKLTLEDGTAISLLQKSTGSAFPVVEQSC